MNLYRVTTKEYKQYYVIAHDYNNAASKLEEHLCDNLKVLDYDGSLTTNLTREFDVTQIELLTDNIIK